MPQIATQIYTFFFGIIHPLHSSENPSVSRTSPFWSALETMTTRTNLSKAPGCHFLMSSALTRVWWMLGRVPVTRSLQPMERSGLTQSSANYIWGWFLACAQIDISLVGLLGERKRIRLATSSWISDDVIAKWEQAQSEQSLTTPVGFFSTVSARSVRIPLFFASTRFCTFRYAKWCTDRVSFLRTETIADTEKKRVSLLTFDCAVSLGPRNATGEGGDGKAYVISAQDMFKRTETETIFTFYVRHPSVEWVDFEIVKYLWCKECHFGISQYSVHLSRQRSVEFESVFECVTSLV